MFVPAATTLTASCLLGVGIAAVHGSATTPSSKPTLLHSRAAVTSVTVSEPSIVHGEGAAPHMR